MISRYVALDLETTGLSPNYDKIIEIGAVRYEDGRETGRYECFVNPGINITKQITEVTGITDEMVKDSPYIEDIIGEFLDFVGDDILLGHNITFDYSFIVKAAIDKGIRYSAKGIDTYKVSLRCLPDVEGRSLKSLCEYFGIDTIYHRAGADAVSASDIYIRMCGIADSDKDVRALFFKPKKDIPATTKQIAFLKSLIGRYRINYDKKIEDLTKSEASREIDKILSTYGVFH